jgi:hypothetical protein
MAHILLSVFGLACLLLLGGATIRAITKEGRLGVAGKSDVSGQVQFRWFFVDDIHTQRVLHSMDSASNTASRRAKELS